MPQSNLFVGARSSKLSQVQVWEVLEELKRFHPHVGFSPLFIATQGDKDQKTSLRNLDKCNFFTKEIDEMLLSGTCRIAIHSAKDLPVVLCHGICMIALTKGLDPSDALVLNEGVTIETLKSNAVIATSSERREHLVKLLRADLSFCDIRGTIEQRLQQLDDGKIDGVVIAEAALMRLGLTNRNRIRLPGETAKYQGQLAILARVGDKEMEDLFACLST